MPDGSVALKQQTAYAFRGDHDVTDDRPGDHADGPGKAVSLTDNKEGVLGLRVTRALEEPSDKPEVFTDAAGRPTTVASLDNTGVNGTLSHERGDEGCGGVGHAWEVVRTVGHRGRRAGVDRDPRSPAEPRLPDLLARARIRPVCRQPARPEGAQRRQGRAELRYRAAPGRHLPLPHRHRERPPCRRRRSEAAWTAWSSRATEASPESRQPVAR